MTKREYFITQYKTDMLMHALQISKHFLIQRDNTPADVIVI